MTAAELNATELDRARAFWGTLGTDPILDEIMRAGRYRIDALPSTALEFLDRLRQLGYSVSKLEILDLEDANGKGRVHVLDGDGGIEVGVVASEAVDRVDDTEGGADVARDVDGAAHEDSSRCAGAATPTSRSVEAAADKAAGSAGGTLAPGPDLALTAIERIHQIETNRDLNARLAAAFLAADCRSAAMDHAKRYAALETELVTAYEALRST